MQRKPNPRALAAAFLLVSGTVSIVLLAARNLYDDEVSSAALVIGSVRKILQFTAVTNVHPPGMDLLSAESDSDTPVKPPAPEPALSTATPTPTAAIPAPAQPPAVK